MFRLTRFCFTSCLFLLFGCDRADVLVAPPAAEPPLFKITDGAHGSGNPHFFFLPPLVRNPTAGGTFDASVAPHVRASVCEWTVTGCASPLVAEFITTSGPGSETVRVEDEHYIVNWHTGRSNLDPAKTYRIRVQVAGTELGHLDLDVVRNGRALKDVDTDHFVGVVNGQTVPIKFRIEEGAVSVVASEGGTFTTVDGNVTLEFPDGALSEPTGITVFPTTTFPADPTLIGGTAYEFGPDGASFAHPVQLTMRYDAAAIPTAVDEALLLIHRAAADHWREVDPRVDGSNVNVTEKTVTGAITGFSTHAILEQRPVASVTVASEEATLSVGETVQLAATLTDANGNELIERPGRLIEWSSSEATVATVDEDGLVTAASGGEATISATSDGQSGSAVITVVGEAGDVILRIEDWRHRYEVDTFGRRVQLEAVVTTGIGVEERCGEVAPQNVVLVLTLPEGATFVSANGAGAFDAAARTVTWQLGTLDARSHCFLGGREPSRATIDVDPSVADGAMLEGAVFAVSTTTPGDDPADNRRELRPFQVGYLPVEVWLFDVVADCVSERDRKRSDDASVSCEGINPGSPSGNASSSASYQPQDGAVPRKVGELPLSGNALTFEARASASAISGWKCTISSCETRNVDAEAAMDLDVRFVNRNPYKVGLWTEISVDAGASCAGPDSEAFSDFSVECDSSQGITSASGTVRVVNDGSSDGVCEVDIRVSGANPRNEQNTLDSDRCPGGRINPFSGTHDVRFAHRIEMEANIDELFANTEIVVGSGGTVEERNMSEAAAFATNTLLVRLAR